MTVCAPGGGSNGACRAPPKPAAHRNGTDCAPIDVPCGQMRVQVSRTGQGVGTGKRGRGGPATVQPLRAPQLAFVLYLAPERSLMTLPRREGKRLQSGGSSGEGQAVQDRLGDRLAICVSIACDGFNNGDKHTCQRSGFYWAPPWAA